MCVGGGGGGGGVAALAVYVEAFSVSIQDRAATLVMHCGGCPGCVACECFVSLITN